MLCLVRLLDNQIGGSLFKLTAWDSEDELRSRIARLKLTTMIRQHDAFAASLGSENGILSAVRT